MVLVVLVALVVLVVLVRVQELVPVRVCGR